MPEKSITLKDLFRNHEAVLEKAMCELRDGKSAAEVCQVHVKPVIDHLIANADTDLDPLYVTYYLQHIALIR